MVHFLGHSVRQAQGKYQWFRTRKVDWLSTSSCHMNKGGSCALPHSFSPHHLGEGCSSFHGGQEGAPGAGESPRDISLVICSSNYYPQSNHPPAATLPMVFIQLRVPRCGSGCAVIEVVPPIWLHKAETWLPGTRNRSTCDHRKLHNVSYVTPIHLTFSYTWE